MEYLLAHTKNSNSYKKLKRKLIKKQHININIFDCKSYQNTFDQDFIGILKGFVQKYQQQQRKEKYNYIGVITDDVTLVGSIFSLPPFPKVWDMICLESEIANYDFSDNRNNLYYTKTAVIDTRHFLINVSAIPKIVETIRKYKTWQSFIESFSANADVFTINGDSISTRNNNKPEMDKRVVQKRLVQFSYEPKYENLFPCVSLITPVTNTDNFFHVIYTFLKLKYPVDKLELVIVCDAGKIKKLQPNIPKDPRIKVINIGNSVECYSQKLNCGVKYAKNEVICHFFDTHCYKNDFLINMTIQLLSKQNIWCVTTTDSCYYDTISRRSYITYENTTQTEGDLGMCIYTKHFWNVRGFSKEQNNSETLYKFTSKRLHCVDFVTCIETAFIVTSGVSLKLKELPFDIKSIVLGNLNDESFDLAFNNTKAC